MVDGRKSGGVVDRRAREEAEERSADGHVWRRRAGARPFVVGHRGVRPLNGALPVAAENTIGSFERALADGADSIELDVRLANDGEAVVFHDEELSRMTGGRDVRRVADVTWTELGALDLVGGGRVPLLTDVLAWARGKARVNVEVKTARRGALAGTRAYLMATGRLAREVAKVVQASGAEVLFSSFDPVTLAALAALAPRVPRAILTSPNDAPVSARQLDRFGAALSRIVSAVNVERREAIPERLIRLRTLGLRVGVWTVNDADEAAELATLGADWIITDAPKVVRAGFARKSS